MRKRYVDINLRSQVKTNSSASRFTADAAGFLILSQSLTRPERYAELSRFDTMPSRRARRHA
jgi:hypothetical protein